MLIYFLHEISKGIGCKEIIQAVNIGFKEGMEEVKKQGKSIEVRSILCCVIFKPGWFFILININHTSFCVLKLLQFKNKIITFCNLLAL